jgi:Zn-finger nucleic acid-binding protein
LLDAENAWHGGPPPQQPHQQQRPYRDRDSDEYPVYNGGHPGKRKKRRGFLEELFD